MGEGLTEQTCRGESEQVAMGQTGAPTEGAQVQRPCSGNVPSILGGGGRYVIEGGVGEGGERVAAQARPCRSFRTLALAD